MDDLIADFIAETREGLEALDSELVRFEQHPDDPELLGGIFRLIHTIKGTCGFLGLMRLQTVAHAAENVLGAFRDGELAVTPGAVSAILDTVDLIRTLIDALSASGAEPAGDDSALIARLEAVLTSGEAPQVSEEPASEAAAPADARPLIEQLGGDATIDAAVEMVLGDLFGPLFGEVFAGTDPDRVQAAFRDGLCTLARGSAGPSDLAAKVLAVAPSADDGVRQRALERIAEALGDLDIASGPIAVLLEKSAMPTLASPQVQEPVQPAEAAPAEGAPAHRPPAMPAAAAAPTPAPAVEGEGAVQPTQTIRVSVDALEHLMTVVSELVLIRNQLIQTLRLEPESPFAAPLNRLNQVTSELQEGVMTTRMQPISGAWAKLPRLIRDLAQELGKSIDLVMSGQETELDRQVLELIKDPLTHMIRNAADHGLETPAERRAAGKPETGRITLAARHEGGAIVIEVADDGRGLPAARIREKATASGLVTLGQAEAMSDAEIRQFIFAPGFSTAGQVTAVSGRGVGMDVVRTNIEKIGGVIELSSVEGEGTRFTIRIPLTLTIVSALIVECCGERFAMPQSSVVELVSASDASGRQIEYIEGAAVLRLRDRLLPLVSLEALLGLDPEQASRGETCIVVAKVGSFTFGVIVDRVFDTEEIVVKPVASVLRHLKLYSGATILGDGSVILILDFKSMSQETGAGQSAAALGQDEAQEAAARVEEDSGSILVFRAANDTLQAAPLASVARIEEIAAGQIERVNGRTVIQYRGKLMPVVASGGGEAEPWPDQASRPLLVFTRDERSVGLLVNEIVDIVNGAPLSDLAASRAGAAGSLIVGGAATELIDVDHYWRTAAHPTGQAPAAVASPAIPPPTAADLKRLLVIDPSPFTQLFLRPLLRQAGYDVTVAVDPAAALDLHEAGQSFHLIMMDASPRADEAKRFAQALGRATRWHRTPLLGLNLSGVGEATELGESQVLDAVTETLQATRGAA